MKKFVIGVIVFAVLIGVGYFWWQSNAKRLLTEQVQQQARAFFVNPESLKVETPKPLQMLDWHTARVPQMQMSGKNLKLREGPQLAEARLFFKNLDITGPPFRLVAVGEGAFAVTVKDTEVTSYLRKRGIKSNPLLKIPADTLTVKFSRTDPGVMVSNQVMVFGKPFTMKAYGDIVESSKAVGQLDFRVERLDLGLLKLEARSVKEALTVINPLVDMSEWPVVSEVTSVTTGDGTIMVRGKITGVQSSLIP